MEKKASGRQRRRNRNFSTNRKVKSNTTIYSNKKSNNHSNINDTKYLIELFKKSSDRIVLQLLDPKFQLENILGQDTFNENDYIIKFIFLIEKAFECNSLSTKLNVLMKLIVPSKLFQYHVTNILNSSQEAFVESVINLCNIFIYLNSFNVSQLEPIRQKLRQVSKYSTTLINLFDQFEKSYQECKALNLKKRDQSFSNQQETLDANLDDFTKMNIVPKLEDILTDQAPFLRKNLAIGSYESVHHYLDVQYRLLREDFMLPLRNGVGNFRDIIKSYKIRNKKKDELSRDVLRQLKQIDNLNIYFNVYMQSCIAAHNGVVFSLQIDTSGMKILDPKRLIYGSLICLSSDYFQTECLIGTIKDKDSDFKHNNLIYVNFCHNYLDVAERTNIPKANTRYVMLESSVYFESYKHVLKALCAFNRDGEYKFPFREHLIYSESLNVQPPKYLKNACFDFRPLLADSKLNEFDNRYSRFAKVNLDREHLWPSADLMKFNKTQYDALKLALKNRLTLIQGYF